MSMVERTAFTIEGMPDEVRLEQIEQGSMFLLGGELCVVVEHREYGQRNTIMRLKSGETEVCDWYTRVTPVKSITVTPYTREEIKELQDE